MENEEILKAMRGVDRHTVATCEQAAREQILRKQIDDRLDEFKGRIRQAIRSAFADALRKNFPELAGPGREDRLGANTPLPTLDTQIRAFQPKPVTVRPNENLQEAMLGAAREGRQTSELPTSPSQQWPSPNHRGYMQQAEDVLADVAKAGDVAVAKFGGRRIGNGQSLECARCGSRFFTKRFGEKPLERLQKHWEEIHGPNALRLETPRHMVSTFVGNRNF